MGIWCWSFNPAIHQTKWAPTKTKFSTFYLSPSLPPSLSSSLKRLPTHISPPPNTLVLSLRFISLKDWRNRTIRFRRQSPKEQRLTAKILTLNKQTLYKTIRERERQSGEDKLMYARFATRFWVGTLHQFWHLVTTKQPFCHISDDEYLCSSSRHSR